MRSVADWSYALVIPLSPSLRATFVFGVTMH
jgi:hypothetical protein